MKFKLPSLTFLVIIFSLLIVPLYLDEEYIYPVYAQDYTASSSANTTDRVIKPVKKATALEIAQERKAKVAEKMDSLQDRFASRTAALRAKLQAFRDRIKAQRVERLNDNLNRLNTLRTGLMARHLSTMSNILDKVESRVNSSSSSATLNNSSVQSTISDARGAISKAKAAVDTQAKNDYTINISSESGVAKDAKVARDKLHADLKATHQLVVAARKAIENAIKTAVSTLKGSTNGQ